MKKIFLLFIVSAFLTACSNKPPKDAAQTVAPKDSTLQATTPTDSTAQKDSIAPAPVENRAEVVARERAHPENYLSALNWRLDQQQTRSASGRKKKEQMIIMNVKNSASFVTFKDFKILVTYYSKTQSVISTANVIAYEIGKPGSSVVFSFKPRVPREMSHFTASVVGATVVN